MPSQQSEKNHAAGDSVGGQRKDAAWAGGSAGRVSIREDAAYSDYDVRSSLPSLQSSKRRKKKKKKNDNDDDDDDDKMEKSNPAPSLQDRIVNAASATGSSALFGTVGLLKMAGGATLSTTGKLVAPPLKVTQEVLLPSLWSAIKDYVSYLTPQRVKDWLRIIFSSLYHFVTVLRNTHRGKVFRERIMTVAADVVDCASSDLSRQVISDSMASLVKLAEALNTPEARDFLDQIAIVGNRMVDVAASGRNKQLIYDLKRAFEAGIELASDPSTTVALAEVTATLCHTLEMEEAIHRKKVWDPRRAAQRRYEHNRFQREAYSEPDLMSEPNKTVEQVIVSSLGGMSTSETPTEELRRTQQPLSVSDEDDDDEGEAAWKHAGKSGVDFQYLKERIAERAAMIERQRMLRTTITTPKPQEETSNTTQTPADGPKPLDDIEDMEGYGGDKDNDDDDDDDDELDGPGLSDATSERNLKRRDGQALPPGSSESALQRFQTALDDITQAKRAAVVQSVLSKEGPPIPNLRVPSVTRVGKKAQDSVRRRLESMGRSMRKETRSLGLVEEPKRMERRVLPMDLFFASLGMVMFVWFLLGCYGMYVYFLATKGVPIVPTPIGANEVVIRIVKEVVHVTPDGETLGTVPINTDLDMEMLTKCISDASK